MTALKAGFALIVFVALVGGAMRLGIGIFGETLGYLVGLAIVCGAIMMLGKLRMPE
jgi:hypothetical protein